MNTMDLVTRDPPVLLCCSAPVPPVTVHHQTEPLWAPSSLQSPAQRQKCKHSPPLRSPLRLLASRVTDTSPLPSLVSHLSSVQCHEVSVLLLLERDNEMITQDWPQGLPENLALRLKHSIHIHPLSGCNIKAISRDVKNTCNPL